MENAKRIILLSPLTPSCNIKTGESGFCSLENLEWIKDQDLDSHLLKNSSSFDRTDSITTLVETERTLNQKRVVVAAAAAEKSKNGFYTVKKDYYARTASQINLIVGQTVFIDSVFSDGWSHGWV